MTMTPYCPTGFSLWDTSSAADFNQCFEESILSVVPSAAVIVFAAIRLYYLRNKQTKYLLHQRHITANRIVSWLSVVAALVAVILSAAVYDSYGSEILAGVFTLLASVAAAVVLHVEHTKLLRASTGLLVYWLVAIIVWIIRLRTLFNKNRGNTAIFIIQLCLNVISFILENLTHAQDPATGDKARPTPLGSNVNVFARVTYWYMQPLLVRGQKQELTLDDLWRPDKSQSSAEIHGKFDKQWKAEIQRGHKTGKKPWLMRALLKAFYPALVVGFAEYCISFACTFVEPMLLQSILLFIGEPESPAYIGYAIAVGIWLNALLNVLMGVQMWISAMSVGFQIRSSLCSAIFRKSMNLTNTSRQATSTGQINNMMAADTNHIQWFITMIYNPIGIPVKIALAIYLLWQQLGVACLGGLAVIIPRQARGDTRIEIVNESLTSIKLLKLYGWDMLFHKRVTDARDLELSSIKSIGVLKSVNSLVGTVTPLFVSLFLLLEELDSSNVHNELSKTGDVITIDKGSFKWDKDATEPILENINLAIPKGSLAAVIGRVGVGKSSLLSALLGEMQKLNGTVRVSGTVAYVSQQAWIENATVRDNILFGSEYDPVKFDAVIEACALRNDLKLLVAGDLTEIGEKGVNLSGGQKQRMALARAVYNDAEIYLLDDVLSAVDAHVDKHIFDNVIGPQGLLKDKTRVLVTHGVHHLPVCDKIIVIKDKTIEQQGGYTELMAQEAGIFRALIDEFAHDVVLEAHEENFVTPSVALETKETAAQEKEESTKKEEGALMTKEDAGKGLAKSSVFVAYSKAAGVIWVVISFTLSAESGNPSGFYLGIYAAIVFVASSLTLLTNLTMYVKVGQNAAKVMHSKMLSGVMRSPMSFFDTNPLGRITNRFVGDIQIVDESLVETYVGFLSYVVQSVSTIIVICSVTPLFLTLILPLFVVYYYIQFYYLKTAQAIQRVSRLTNSPVYALANTSFTGISTLRAFGKTENGFNSDSSASEPVSVSVLPSLQLFSAIVISPGSAGLSLGYAMQITQYLYHTMRMFGQVQNSGVSLERIFEYFDLPSEAPQFTDRNGKPVNDWLGSDKADRDDFTNWPSEGRVVFKDLKMRYREGTPLILNGISVALKGGEKVGIVGRTGAGKSSLSVALFRLSEAESGSIEVDGIDISRIGLNTLRTRLTIIPQEPVLFGASVRDNIDPSHQFSDEAIWRALEAAHLKDRFGGHEEGLEQKVKSGGENLSIGERQLFCLARALLRNTKVLILDEASSGIDLETDALIQATIRREFKEATVLTIAHRIQTIMDSDKILVLNAGTVEEFESPQTLLANPESAFSKLAAAAERELSDFVSYLLDGSGVENVVDLQRLRRELEDEASNGLAPSRRLLPPLSTTAPHSDGHHRQLRPPRRLALRVARATLTRHRSALLASPGRCVDASAAESQRRGRRRRCLTTRPRNASQSDQAAGNARGHKSESFRESEQRDSGRKESTRPMQLSISASQLQQQVHHQPSRQASLQLLDEFIKQSVPTTADSEKLEVSENANAMNSMHHYPVSPIAPSSQHRKMSVGNELSRKTEDTQKLSERITNSLEERQKLEDQVQQYADDLKRGESKDWKIIQEQQDSLTSASSQIAVLRSDLVSAKHDAQDAKVIQAQLKKRLAQAEIEKLEAVSELETFKAKVEKTRKQNEQNFTRIAETVNRYKTDVSKSGIDRLTLEVIEVYESKLADLRKEVSELSAGNQTQQTEPTDLTGSFSRANRVVDFDQEIHSLERSGFPQTRHFARQGPDGENYTVSVDSTKMIHAQRLLEEKVRDLEDRLESAQKKGTEAIQQSELLRLQLLENTGLSTRELIRRDKQSWKMKLYQIDAMNLDECRTMLKNVCIHLAITDVPSLLPGLAAIDSTLRLLPQLQSFITTIDTLVHKHYTHLFETNSGGETNSKNGSTLQSLASSTKKLNELTEIVAMWAHASQEVESLRDFRQTMHRALGVRESGGSLAGCLEIVGASAGGANSSNIRDNSGEEVGLQRFVDELYHLFGVRDGVGSLQVLLDVCRGLKIAVEEGGNRSGPGVLGIRVSKGSLDSCLQQLDDLIQRLDSGGADAAVDGFLESVHRVLGVNRKPGSLDDCLAVIRILVEKGRTSPQVQKQNYELYSRLVEHFMELFEIKTVDEVNSAVNELYVMFSERNARYRQSQSNVQSQPPQSQPTQNQDMSLDPFNDEDFMQAVTDAANFQNETLDHNPIPLDWAVDDDDIGPHQQQQQELDQARSRGSVGAGAPNRSWQEISSSIRNLTSGLGGVA
ncbi:hypothetical protein BDR26DRAFT_930068 [Obelidium mucronatum]|nr:hypothetical protein BDR26DRAFT_930068 [Obelidium mucronatum]